MTSLHLNDFQAFDAAVIHDLYPYGFVLAQIKWQRDISTVGASRQLIVMFFAF